MNAVKSLLDLTAADVMRRDVVVLHPKMSLREAAGVLRLADVTGAPVVDDRGRCLGVLSTVDFLRWVEEGAAPAPLPIRTCPYQTDGRLLTGEKATICVCAEGALHLQVIQPTTAGRHTAVCKMPHDVLSDWQQVIENAHADEVGKYMTADVVTVKRDVLVTELARKMIDAHIHRVVVADEDGQLIGVVSATDVLAAVAREEAGVTDPVAGIA